MFEKEGIIIMEIIERAMGISRCEYCDGTESRAIIRTRRVCRDCFTLFQQDNKLRCIKNIEIPDRLILIKTR